MTDFRELGVGEERTATLRRMGISSPTPIQEKAIPPILAGRDLIGQAQTGTGKTLAFVLPMLERINPGSAHVQGLIVSPTRELAIQITAEVKKLVGGRDDLRVLAVYGGQDVEAQMHKLQRSVQLIVCTPGRLLDHLRRETVELTHVKMLVLDEADQMLHMGFLTEVEEILRAMPQRRQTMLFSATMPATVRALAARFLDRPEEVTVRGQQVTVKDIRQWAVETTDRAKQETLQQLIDEQQPYLAMIFCRTKKRASTLNEALQELGYNSDELHGDLSQSKREQVMARFRDAKLQLLVATDVAARGLDVEGVTHVFNYDIPHDVESYIHRIGRTGRAGGSGLAITLVAPSNRPELAAIEDGIGLVLERRRMDEGRSVSAAGAGREPRSGGSRSQDGRGKRDSSGGYGRGGQAKQAGRGNRGGEGDGRGEQTQQAGRGNRGGEGDGRGGQTQQAGRGNRGGAGSGRSGQAEQSERGSRAGQGESRGGQAQPTGRGSRAGEGESRGAPDRSRDGYAQDRGGRASSTAGGRSASARPQHGARPDSRRGGGGGGKPQGAAPVKKSPIRSQRGKSR